MATVVLSAAGSSLGSMAGGSLLGIGSAALGRAAGAVIGGLIDQKIMGSGAQTVETGRLERLRIQGAGEGATIPALYGRMRVGGHLIWSSRFIENVDETRRGGKGGGQKVREFSYTVSLAIALCEGTISRIGRVWADGNQVSLSDITHRVHRGNQDQLPDPLIDDIEKGAPAFRGVAYVVIEDLPLARFGNRVPQFNFEVYREPQENPNADAAESAPPLSALVNAVALSPGSGEFSLDTVATRRVIGPGQTVYENVNTTSELPDILSGLDQLEAEAPACDSVSLIVSWFGDDLRCGSCTIRPCVESEDKETGPETWRVSGIERDNARVVSTDAEGRPIYGGTPSDGSVIRAIQEMKARGLNVMFYPFILMDVPPENTLRDPWTGAVGQPVFPWRGRITLNRAPGVAGSTDKTPAAAAEVAAFFGDARRGDFTRRSDTVTYTGPNEWSFRRFILHYAHLCVIAGGVESFCISSELRSLTQIRSGQANYPSVAAMKALAADVRAILGPTTKISYAADWSEYFGHQPGDGTGDFIFHLDPLWADPNIDFIGIDNYFPLADWRYEEGHADEEAGSPYSLTYLSANVAGGEGYDWYYESASARDQQIRTPIVDGAHGEDWIFRPKDLRNWWERPHHNRPGGVRSATPTEWVSQSKPFWFTELGCPAVDLGANQPNVFFDPKSSENALPYYSRGVRDDYMQRRYIQATLTFWNKGANNPTSVSYGRRMVKLNRTFLWTWDARPWPDFPDRTNVWSDGPNHRLGHWLTGRLGASSLADVVAEICTRSGVFNFDVSELSGVVQGYLLSDVVTGRAALQPLMLLYAFDAVESEGVLKFRHRDRRPDGALSTSEAVLSDGNGAEIELTRGSEGDLPQAVRISYLDSERDYESGAVEAKALGGASTRIESTDAPLLMDAATAQDVVDRWLSEARAGRETATGTFARRRLGLEPGDILALSDQPGAPLYRVERLEDLGSRAMTLTRIDQISYARSDRKPRPTVPQPTFAAVPVVHRFLDLPLITGAENGPGIAAFATPWSGTASLYQAGGSDGFEEVTRCPRPATIGRLTADLPRSSPHIWSRNGALEVQLFGGGLESVPDLSVLNGANFAAIWSPLGDWELLQFQQADLIGANRWRLSRLLRGQQGTEWLIADTVPAGADFVLLNTAIQPIPSPSAMRGVERRWRIGPSRKPHTHESYVAFQAADNAIRLRPYAPVHLRVRRMMSGDFQLSWVRRARSDGDTWAGAEPPLGESREAYRVRIGSLRSEEAVRTEFIYSAAAQAADALSGFVEIGVAQLSDQFGPGPETKVMIHV